MTSEILTLDDAISTLRVMMFDSKGSFESREMARVLVEEFNRLHELERSVADPRHVVDFRADGFTIQHPVGCRPDLHACVFNQLVAQHGLPDDGPGLYEAHLLDDDELLVTRTEMAA